MKPPYAPMLATLAAPFDDPAFFFEVKWDGWRAIVVVGEQGTRIFGRRSELTDRFPGLGHLHRVLPGPAIYDGELVAFRHDLPSISALAAGAAPRYMLFDCLEFQGRPLLSWSFGERRAFLQERIPPDREPVHLSDGIMGQGQAMYRLVTGRGLEGVVGKRLASPYRPGRRSPDWRKIPRRQEGRFLLVAVRIGADGGLRAIGVREDPADLSMLRVGTGWGAAEGAALLARAGIGEPLGGTWFRVRFPIPVRVAYLERTAGGLRHASLLGEGKS